jgi:voltage-gated potassium channel
VSLKKINPYSSKALIYLLTIYSSCFTIEKVQQLGVFMFVFFRFIRRKLKHKPIRSLFALGMGMVVLWLCYVLLYMHFEQNPDLLNATYQFFQLTSTVGYGDAPPASAVGKIFTSVFMIVGVAFLAGLIGGVVELIEYNKERRRFGQMNNKFSNGYVIFNMPSGEQVFQLIDQIRAVEPNVPICLVDADIDELPGRIASLPKVHFVQGNTLAKETYERANLQTNKTIIVLPTKPSDPNSDGNTQTIVQLLLKFIDQKKTKIIAMLCNDDNAWLFDDLDCSVISESLAVKLIVQESQDPGSGRTIEKLLSNKEGAIPLRVEIDQLAGKTWFDFKMGLLLTSKEENLSIESLAITNSDSFTTPSNDYVLQKEDGLIVLVEDAKFAWKQFEDKIVKSIPN